MRAWCVYFFFFYVKSTYSRIGARGWKLRCVPVVQRLFLLNPYRYGHHTPLLS